MAVLRHSRERRQDLEPSNARRQREMERLGPGIGGRRRHRDGSRPYASGGQPGMGSRQCGRAPDEIPGTERCAATFPEVEFKPESRVKTAIMEFFP